MAAGMLREDGESREGERVACMRACQARGTASSSSSTFPSSLVLLLARDSVREETGLLVIESCKARYDGR